MTDPSGFAWQDTGSTGGNVAWGIGAAAWGGTAIYAARSASSLSLSGLFMGGSSTSAGAGGVGLGTNAVITLVANPFGGSPEGEVHGAGACGGVEQQPGEAGRGRCGG
jgi:hypothetical protein